MEVMRRRGGNSRTGWRKEHKEEHQWRQQQQQQHQCISVFDELSDDTLCLPAPVTTASNTPSIGAAAAQSPSLSGLSVFLFHLQSVLLFHSASL